MTAYKKFTDYLQKNGISLEFLMDALSPTDVSFMETTIKMMKMFNDDVFYDAAVRITERTLSDIEMLNSAYGIQNNIPCGAVNFRRKELIFMEKIYVYEGRVYKENHIDKLMWLCNAWDYENFAEFLIVQCSIELTDILAEFEDGTLSDFLNECRKKYIAYFKEEGYLSYEIETYELAE